MEEISDDEAKRLLHQLCNDLEDQDGKLYGMPSGTQNHRVWIGQLFDYLNNNYRGKYHYAGRVCNKIVERCIKAHRIDSCTNCPEKMECDKHL